jgi:serine/threonine protein kinase
MTPERWQEIETVFQQALEQPPRERASFLDQACAGDRELREEATTLIAAYGEAADFIEQPAMAQDAHLFLGADIGREVGPYHIIERLGAGGMADVYLAHDSRLNRLVALKLMPPYFASDDGRLRRFQSEARAASALNHPNILTIHEVGEADGVYFIATEFIEGQTIRELIEQQTLSAADTLDGVEQVASALSVAHAAGIVHRDIKPENIMRRPDGLVKILDFGIAKLLEQETPDPLNETTGFQTQTEIGLVLGTVSYMAPEQARGLAVDERTDIWSIGVVLYEMLTGRLPFTGATRMDTLVAILDREPAPLSDRVAPLLQSIIRRCLSKEMVDRYRTAGELLVDLKRAKEELRSPRDSSLQQAARASFRFSWSIIAAVVLVVAGFLGLFLYKLMPATNSSGSQLTTTVPAKPYSQMSEQEQLDFVGVQGRRISAMMGDRPVKLNDDAVRVIKLYVDRYAGRIDGPTGSVEGSTRATYERARPHIPLIARSFAARRVPIVIGLYLPVIESGYRECSESPLGAKGLFQLMPETAQSYGVARDQMCDEQKMTPAAAHYIADRMAELGEDAESVTLVLLSYNRGENWVRDTLRQLRGTENYERNFWALIANRHTLDESLPKETAGYVPNFFAAAIVGENPEAFGLQTPPLSTLARDYR